MWKALAALLTVGLALAGAAHAETRRFTAHDLAMLDQISDPQLSPDGRYLAYTLRSTDWTNNRGVGSIWLHDRRAPTLPPRVLAISDRAAAAPRWSPDGRSLYFLSARSGTTQIWRTDPDGATATPVTSLPLPVTSYRISRDGRTIVAALQVYPDCPDLPCSRARAEARRAGASALVYDRLAARQWDEWRGPQQNRLFALHLDDSGAAASPPVALMRGFEAEAPDRPSGDDSEFAVSATHVYFIALRPGEPWGGKAHYRLWASPLDGSKPPVEVAPDLAGGLGKPALSPDGTRLAVLRKSDWRVDIRARVHLIDLASGAHREVETGLDRSPEDLRWSADGRALLAVMADAGRIRLFGIDAATGRTRRLTETGSVASVATAPGRLVVLKDSLTSPGQLYEVSANGPVLLAGHNAQALAEFDFSRPAPFTFKGWNDATVHGWVLPPQGAKPGQRYPVAFLIHGGPHDSSGDNWSYRWNPQVWTGMGYAVVMIDFHGSGGYGEAFAQAILGHWGDRPLEDLKKGWAAALARFPYLDGTRACALGGSYGGYMVAWIAGAWPDPWRCLVNHAGITDTRAFALTTDIPGYALREFGAEVWADPEAAERLNPTSALANWRTPMLLIHGARDYRVPVDQGLSAFTALQRRGVPSRLVVYPDEHHWVLKPRNSVDWYAQVQAWMDRWTAPAQTPR